MWKQTHLKDLPVQKTLPSKKERSVLHLPILLTIVVIPLPRPDVHAPVPFLMCPLPYFAHSAVKVSFWFKLLVVVAFGWLIGWLFFPFSELNWSWMGKSLFTSFQLELLSMLTQFVAGKNPLRAHKEYQARSNDKTKLPPFQQQLALNLKHHHSSQRFHKCPFHQQ